MSAHVISHRRPRRKRGGPSPRRSGYGRAGGRGFLRRRFGALVITIAALGAASWLAPCFYRPPPAPSAEVIQAPPLANPSAPPPAEIAETVQHTEPHRQAQRPRRARRGVALDAHAERAEADFEVLSAAELDAISQARD